MFNFPLAPPAASNFAKEHDFVFYLLCTLSLIFTLLVAAGVIFFAVRYRAGNKVDRSRPMYENLTIELTLTFVPLVLGLVVFWLGARLFVEMRTPPKDAQEIYVVGKQWMWHIQHSNGVRENNTLHVPVGKPVKLTMISQDVIHAFYIPAFRVQMHVVPGRYTSLWFTATKAGEYHLFCGMYCGTQHSEMGGKVIAMEPAEYAKWLGNGGESVAPMSMAQAGQRLYSQLGCANCHAAESTPRAPSLVGIWGSKRVFTDGSALIADQEYLRESIFRPYNHITAGYDESMPVYEGSEVASADKNAAAHKLSETDILNLVAYIKSMGASDGKPAPSSITNLNEAATTSSKTDSQDALSVGAIQANHENPDATPTHRNQAPAVGAIAAEGQGQIR